MGSIPSWFVIVMGLGTVFVGLICLILICKILSMVFSRFQDNDETYKRRPDIASPATGTATFSNRQEVIAAIGAVIAEDLGVDVTGIRITSIRKI